jgi:hypothetical protein
MSLNICAVLHSNAVKGTLHSEVKLCKVKEKVNDLRRDSLFSYGGIINFNIQLRNYFCTVLTFLIYCSDFRVTVGPHILTIFTIFRICAN